MEQPKHLGVWWKFFPWNKYPTILPNQEKALDIIFKKDESLTIEMPTGSGKTATGYTFLRTLQDEGKRNLYYVTPNKNLVNQIKELHPEVKVIYGRNEYKCLFYKDKYVGADECGCTMLDCPHRVNQDSGMTEVDNTDPCPYLRDKFIAKQGGIIVCTTAFYVLTQLFASKSWEKPQGLVLDEAHRMAQVTRSVLSYEITDYHLKRGIKFLEDIGVSDTKVLRDFLEKMTQIIKQKPKKKATLLEAEEIRELFDILNRLDPAQFDKDVRGAIKASGMYSDDEHREILKKLEVLTRDLFRYYRSLEYSMPGESRPSMNYTFAYSEGEEEAGKRIGFRLYIKAYSVAGIISKRLLCPRTLAYSATIGDNEDFGWETGIKFPYYSLPSNFPVKNARVFLPTDTPNLAMKSRRKDDVKKILRSIARACKTFADKKIRSLVVVVSTEERNKFLEICTREGVSAISYGNGYTSREAARRFKDGEGDVLVGTTANYGEGLDLPRQIAPVIFFLRPGYPTPTDPATIFEERRYGSRRWAIWNWRVMIEALQVRGRNIRSAEDVGVTFFISQQFRRFLYRTLPDWLDEAYQGKNKFEECVEETLTLLSK